MSATAPPVPPPLPALHQTRCFNHALREAVARCPGCGQFYCRECVTEHTGRLLCRGCVERAAAAPRKRAALWRKRLLPVLRFAAGLLLLYFVFQFAGRVMQAMPSEYQQLEKPLFAEDL